MSIDANPKPPTVSSPVARLSTAGLTHQDIHTVAQHGCYLCPPTPCSCGHSDGVCPQVFEHRREYAGAETTWIEAAR